MSSSREQAGQPQAATMHGHWTTGHRRQQKGVEQGR